MSSLQGTMRRLERLHVACGGTKSAGSHLTTSMKNNDNDNNKEEEVDTSQMTAYEKGQYRIACFMKRVRENVSHIETTGDSMNITQRTEISNSIRRDISNMKKEAVILNRIAVKEGRREDYNQLMIHVNKTEQLQRARFGAPLVDDAIGIGSSSSGGGFTVSGATAFTYNNHTSHESSVPLLSAREDDEFALFFEQTKMRDKDIDESLDRIGAGLERLNENALLLNSELSTQQRLLDDTETKVDNVHGKLVSMNARLRKTLKEMDKDKVAIYIFCCLLLLGIMGGIYFVAS
ncbi:syntaxin [Trypanosoma theileri]|uniref:Syntaxin n=1 Tax=Trypanosoma theileri TaxID=67003 RepID=A0A1X0P2V3_9TRYP|nr:syntaxin [Trypanosoma theileri]ORC91215.1 syntaxin [Trypanosoma theileri]